MSSQGHDLLTLKVATLNLLFLFDLCLCHCRVSVLRLTTFELHDRQPNRRTLFHSMRLRGELIRLNISPHPIIPSSTLSNCMLSALYWTVTGPVRPYGPAGKA